MKTTIKIKKEYSYLLFGMKKFHEFRKENEWPLNIWIDLIDADTLQKIGQIKFDWVCEINGFHDNFEWIQTAPHYREYYKNLGINIDEYKYVYHVYDYREIQDE